ncbi:hypothetical protein EIN_077610 [Entamoeba invadens IP1]|uniref:Uncharacterized protein n=1 Tax=Entamoeba invadens IP1 TaxID=370355 RepID=A0A0A1TUD2_ENTIV|nr:hypothetical protein EIN_077610 [Entamoeba invadens IP1]ELP83586.1 hypothetical protein EIN_077610 [Entamoeba invadens IP1]|eukprot:XP_004182932.1 hypothetical protein EIN_077610 [Entamoeba invadens IP1]
MVDAYPNPNYVPPQNYEQPPPPMYQDQQNYQQQVPMYPQQPMQQMPMNPQYPTPIVDVNGENKTDEISSEVRDKEASLMNTTTIMMIVGMFVPLVMCIGCCMIKNPQTRPLIMRKTQMTVMSIMLGFVRGFFLVWVLIVVIVVSVNVTRDPFPETPY